MLRICARMSLGPMALALLVRPFLSCQFPQDVNTETILIQVLDETHSPLQGVSKVRLEREDGMLIEEVDTDSEGRFQFSDVPKTHLVVVVQREGYVTARERLGAREAMREIFLAVTLSKSARLRENADGGPRVRVDYLSAPPKARKEYKKGIEQVSHGYYEKAADHLEKATRLYPQSPTFWNDLGSNDLRLKKYDLAERAFRKALGVDNSFTPALFNLGLLYNAQRQFREAEMVLSRFAALQEHEWQGFFELGDAHYGLSEFSKAEADFTHAMDLNPNAPAEIHVKLGNVYASRRQFSKAFGEFEIYLKQQPNGALAARVSEITQRMKADGVMPNGP